MPTSTETVETLLALLSPKIPLTAKKMFGEYGLYFDGKMVGSICDDHFFIKPTDEGKALAIAAELRFSSKPPYPMAKPCWWIEEKIWTLQSSFLAELLALTAQVLPEPKIRKSTLS
jgi:DNA transformation protein